jgi:Na+/proline symporter
MRSVVWNDCVQFTVYMVGALLAAWVILDRLPGGWSQYVEYGIGHGKFRLFDFSLDLSRTYTFWSGIVGGVFITLATHGTDQMMVQRYLAAGSLRKAGRALAASGFVICAQFAVFLLLGVGLACFYDVFPPDTPFEKNDEVFASFIVNHLPVGLVGITLAAVFAAAMSTLSSSLNSSATAAVNDFYLPRFERDPSVGHVLRVSRGLTVVFGAIQIGVAIAGDALELERSVIDNVLAIASFTSGAVLGVFFLGVLTRHVSQKSALVGLVSGLTVLTLVAFGPPLLAKLDLGEPWHAIAAFRLAWPWYAVVGSLTTFLVGLAASVAAKRQDCELEGTE